jgi:hypothetical protein
VVAKAEHIDGKSNPRFVVTSLDAERVAAQALYEDLYCARGDMENRIKEQFWLFADRVSAETMRANQYRLYLSVMAYILVNGLRRIGLQGTELASAQVSSIRLKLLKIGAQIRVTVRRVWISLASSFPLQSTFARSTLTFVVDRTHRRPLSRLLTRFRTPLAPRPKSQIRLSPNLFPAKPSVIRLCEKCGLGGRGVKAALKFADGFG